MTNRTDLGAEGGTNDTRKKWTIMVYMASSRDLRDAALESLFRMGMVGSTDHFDVLLQFDSSKPGVTTERYRLLPFENPKEIQANLAALHELEPEQIQETLKTLLKTNPTPDYSQVLKAFEAGKRIDLHGFLKKLHLSADARRDLDAKLKKEETWQNIANKPELLETLILESALLDLRRDHFLELPDTDAGDPGALRDFINRIGPGNIEWGKDLGNAEHNMLILWGHGDGFSIAGDATLRNLLSPDELNTALQQANRRIDVLGFNSCLMGMLEVYDELSSGVEFGVASEGFIPETSWPYEQILSALDEKCRTDGGMVPKELARTIVEEYTHSFAADKDKQHVAEELGVDLAACDLQTTESVVNALRDLADALLRPDPDDKLKEAVIAARMEAQTYKSDYVDLHHFCKLLLHYCDDEKIEDACIAVLGAVRKMAFERMAVGDRSKASRGVSVYFPSNKVSRGYANLKIKEIRWDIFLRHYVDEWIPQFQQKLAKAA
jgi:hypothetical protein